MELIDKTVNGLTFQVSPQLDRSGVAHGFTTRTGGVSQGIFSTLNLGTNRGDDPALVRENYRRVCAALGLDTGKLVFSSQVHGPAVRCITSADIGKGLDRPLDYDADGLITDIPGVALTVFGADCLTVLLCDPVRRVVAAVHTGWRGTALGIVERAVEQMSGHYGSDPADILAAIGPGISSCCFETDEDVPNAMTAALGASVLPFLSGGGGGKFHVDLKGINALRLERAGLSPDHVDLSPDCTFCRPDRYWSHRYTGGERGSQAALIALL
ncbi:MAG: peptidoglycan editing factor PgeF [Pseudoflavonifractor sp.]|nr:peptidoglycan editing factor PgeF [Pseudoflavonifractor sp.]